MSPAPRTPCWLMKAEPDSRVVKNQDVKFSVDDFERVGITPWEGVRNHEAKNLMMQMRIGDRVLFYHSNCKNPGVAAFAEVVKEGYPDYTAWDQSHPYFDTKTKKDSPTWYMVEVEFKSRASHFVPLSVLKGIPAGNVPEYLTTEDVEAIKGMALINRGRLSVQRVEEEAWDAVRKMAERGGWSEELTKKAKGRKKQAAAEGVEDGAEPSSKEPVKPKNNPRKRKTRSAGEEDSVPVRRSTRARTKE
ncbi:DUF55-domain-containing protein [Thelephora terrestris]|uniref:DUF55-domain-containing protein n=1 Tax=Thelephora terrestris TaxID=56493 RepID=A0A9P6HAW0_9AGAM|nr:DUF55-domain-containing protein [Thelephora terrestris]